MIAFNREELLGLLRAARVHRERDWLAICLAYNHALRASEVIHLTGNNFVDGYIELDRLKGSKHTVQPLLDDPEPLLDERQATFDFLRGMYANQRLFPFTADHFTVLVKKYGKQAGIPAHKCHAHTLKHSICIHTIQIAGIENVRQWAGHKSIASTGEYLKVTDAEAAEAIRKARGL